MASIVGNVLTSSRRGFTLIELLVVIVIIAVLAGILLPAIGLVKSSAWSSKCQSNWRQFALANFAYAMDWEGSLVPVYYMDNTGGVVNSTRWDVNVDYLNRVADSGSPSTSGWTLSKGIMCPVSKAANPSGGMTANYAMNDMPGGGLNYGVPNKTVACSTSQMKAEVFMITDGLDYKLNSLISSFNPNAWQSIWEGKLNGAPGNTIALRHRNRANAVMHDGSVAAYEGNAFAKGAAIWK